MTARWLSLLAALVFVPGCAGPGTWAEDLADKLKCHMSVEDVKRVSGKSIETMEVPMNWVTHFIRVNDTDLRLGFEQDGLRWVQVAWMAEMKKVASYQRVDLCGS